MLARRQSFAARGRSTLTDAERITSAEPARPRLHSPRDKERSLAATGDRPCEPGQRVFVGLPAQPKRSCVPRHHRSGHAGGHARPTARHRCKRFVAERALNKTRFAAAHSALLQHSIATVMWWPSDATRRKERIPREAPSENHRRRRRRRRGIGWWRRYRCRALVCRVTAGADRSRPGR
jgi:hypothetical protein